MENDSDSLADLAIRGQLPAHQYMDEGTLRWIEENNPFVGVDTVIKFLPVARTFFDKYVPDRDWFLNDKIVDSIHGLRHLLRVAVHSVLLSSNNDKIGESVVLASLLHDIRRIDDKDDFDHGKRSADWFSKNSDTITDQLGVELYDEALESVYFGIYYHNLSYGDFSDDLDYKKHSEIVDIVKTADALDRFRLPKLKWWPDDKYLTLIPSEEHKRFAYDLVVGSEALFLDGASNLESIQKVVDEYYEN